MERLLDNPFMKKLQEWGEKIGKNKFLSSLQAAMMGTMGIILVGSVAQILMVFLGPNLLKIISEKKYSLYFPKLYLSIYHESYVIMGSFIVSI